MNASAFRNNELGFPDDGASRVAELQSQGDADLPRVAELARWHAGIPESDAEKARLLWEQWHSGLREQPSDADRELERFFVLTVQRANSAPNDERRELLELALEVQTTPAFVNVHCASLAIASLAAGDTGDARRWLSTANVSCESLLGDSAYRVARACLALCEGNAGGALKCVGNTPDATPIARPYRALATVYRAHALDIAGQKAKARDALDALIADVGWATVKRIVDKLPPLLQLDRHCLEKRLRRHFQVGALVRGATAALCAGAALVLALWWPAFGGSVDRGGAEFAAIVLLALTPWLLYTGWRQGRIAGDGEVLRAKVSGRIRYKGVTKRVVYHLRLEAIRSNGDEVLARSIGYYSAKRASQLQNRELEVIWHPQFPTVALTAAEQRGLGSNPA